MKKYINIYTNKVDQTKNNQHNNKTNLINPKEEFTMNQITQNPNHKKMNKKRYIKHNIKANILKMVKEVS